MFLQADIGREESVISFLRDMMRPEDLKIERLTIGDYLICSDTHIYACFERKTLNDFIASIMDGRYENRGSMIDLRSQTGCQLFYIVEGTGLFAHSKKNGNHPTFPLSKIDHAMNSLMVRDGIYIVRTKNQEHTAEQLIELLSTFNKFIPVKIGAGNEVQLAKTQPVLTIEQRVIDILFNITGISKPVAIFLSKSICLRDLFHKNIDIHSLNYCGKPLRSPIINILNNIEEHKEQILKAIRGVGETKYLALKDISLEELSDKPIEQVSNLQYKLSNGKFGTIGLKLAEEISLVFNWKFYTEEEIIPICQTNPTES
jgi:ERCC4-type nuclease